MRADQVASVLTIHDWAAYLRNLPLRVSMHALITGATGLIGTALVAKLAAPRVVSRDPRRISEQFGARAQAVEWNARDRLSEAAFEGIDTIFHLAGEPVAGGRWTDEKRKRIRDSRVMGTKALVDSLAALAAPPAVLVSASAVGFYGDRGDEELTEDSSGGEGFLAEVCAGWEREAMRAQQFGVRVVCARVGLVLSRRGGALQPMLPVFRLGIGGALGSGKQWMPWIHVDDTVNLLLHAANRDDLSGPMNVAAPNPVTNRAFSRELGHVLHRPAVFRVPSFALRAALGEFGAVALGSQRVVPKRALDTGFSFAYAELQGALAALFPLKGGRAASERDVAS